MSGVLESFCGKFLPSDKCLIQVRTTKLTPMLLHMLQHNIKKNQENLTQDFSQLFVHGSVFQPGPRKFFLGSEGLECKQEFYKIGLEIGGTKFSLQK